MFDLNPKKLLIQHLVGRGPSSTVHPYEEKGLDDRTKVVRCVQVKSTLELKRCIEKLVLGFNHNHPSIASYNGFDIQGIKSGGWNVFFRMPRMERSLQDVIDNCIINGTRLAKTEVLKYFFSIANGLAYLEEKKIVYNNVQPNAVFLDRNGNAKLAGLTYAEYKPWKGSYLPDQLQNYGTLKLSKKAPTVTPPKENAFKSDVYRLATTIIRICEPKLKRVNLPDQILDLKNIEIHYGDLVDVLKPLLDPDETKRPTFHEVCKMIRERYYNEVYNYNVLVSRIKQLGSL